LVKEMCDPLDLLMNTVRKGVRWYITANHQCPYHFPDVEHFQNESCHRLAVNLSLLMDNNINLSWLGRILCWQWSR
jgi:hypothetical protein